LKSIEEYIEMLESIEYSNTSDDPDISVREITFRVDDGTNYSNDFTRDLLVIAENDPPVIIDPISGNPIDTLFLSTNEDTPLDTLIYIDIDPENDSTFILTGFSNDGNGNIIPDGSEPLRFSYQPELNYFGIENLTVVVADNGDPIGYDSLVVNVDVLPVNDAPEIRQGGVSVDTLRYSFNEDTSAKFCVEVFDVEGDQVAISSLQAITSDVNGQADDIDDLCFNVSASPDFFGLQYMKVFVKDTGVPEMQDSAIVELNILPSNDPPVIVENNIPVDTIYRVGVEDQPIDICVEAIDIDGDIVVVSEVNTLLSEGNATVPGNDLCFSYTPGQDFFGTDLIQVIVCDDGNPILCDTAYVSISIEGVDDPPVAVNDTVSTIEDTETIIDVLLNDFDPDGDGIVLQTQLIALPGNGEALVNDDGTITYRSKDLFFGTDSFIYQICDDTDVIECDEATVYIYVEPKPLLVFQAVSPNGDGFNDLWIIQGIQKYPDNEVRLFDRYNNLVYQESGYDNVDTYWAGISNIRDSKELPDGTYFYVIDLGNGEELLKGFIVLKR
jgi:gliding motility-associated-like protein